MLAVTRRNHPAPASGDDDQIACVDHAPHRILECLGAIDAKPDKFCASELDTV
jgi:hypothetical protein